MLLPDVWREATWGDLYEPAMANMGWLRQDAGP